MNPFEILVVDNALGTWQDKTRDLVVGLAREDGRIRYTRVPQAGCQMPVITALAQARFELAAFTDDDRFVNSCWPLALVAGFTTDQEALCITGLVAPSSLDTSAERYFDSRYSWGEGFLPSCRIVITYGSIAIQHSFIHFVLGAAWSFDLSVSSCYWATELSAAAAISRRQPRESYFIGFVAMIRVETPNRRRPGRSSIRVSHRW